MLTNVEPEIIDVDELMISSPIIHYPDVRIKVSTKYPASLESNPCGSSKIIKSQATDYNSPLRLFKSFRFSPDFKSSVSTGYRSFTYGHRIDPYKELCNLDLLNGYCDVDYCEFQHLRDCTLTGNELIADMAGYTEGDSFEDCQKFSESVWANLVQLRSSGVYRIEQLVDSIVQHHQEHLHDSSRVVKFCERVEITSEKASQLDTVPPAPLTLDGMVAYSGQPEPRPKYKQHREGSHVRKIHEARLVKTDNEVNSWISYAVSKIPADDADERSIYEQGPSQIAMELDYTTVNLAVGRVLKRLLEGSPITLQPDVLNDLLRVYRKDVNLFLWMCKVEENCAHFDQCRKILLACAERFPLSEEVWRLVRKHFTLEPEETGQASQPEPMSAIAVEENLQDKVRFRANSTSEQAEQNSQCNSKDDGNCGMDMDCS